MEKTIDTNWNELWPIINILNEVCHGIKINDFEKEIGFNYEEILALLEKINFYKVEENESNTKIKINLSDFEIDIINKCLNVVLKHIDDWEFQTRIGVYINEVKRISIFQ